MNLSGALIYLISTTDRPLCDGDSAASVVTVGQG